MKISSSILTAKNGAPRSKYLSAVVSKLQFICSKPEYMDFITSLATNVNKVSYLPTSFVNLNNKSQQMAVRYSLGDPIII